MPNIVITEYCNLKCPYCFASQMIEEAKDKCDNKNISENQLYNILNWLRPSAIEKDFCIGLIGGEPLLHPDFETILTIINDFTASTQSQSIIFTNGLLLHKYLHLISKDTAILINVNKINDTLKKQLIHNLHLINNLSWFENEKVHLGCNLYLEEIDYSYFWNIVDLFKTNIKAVRMSVTAPTAENRINKELYYQKMKPIMLNFLQEAKKRNLTVSYDCNQIPTCFLNENELQLYQTMGKVPPKYCNPVIDIKPNFYATSCFGAYSPIDCSIFNNIEELTRYFQSQIFIKTQYNNQGKCKNCSEIEYMKCQGGCLSFSNPLVI